MGDPRVINSLRLGRRSRASHNLVKSTCAFACV